MLRLPLASSLVALAALPVAMCAVLATSGCIREESPADTSRAERSARADAAPESAHAASLDAAAASAPDGARAPSASSAGVESGAAAPDSGVAQARPVSFHLDEPYASQGANVRATLAFDQPTAQKPGATPDDKPTTVYAAPKDFAKLVIYLHCAFDTRAPDAPTDATRGPLASLESVQVFSADGGKPIAVFTREQLTYSQTNQPGIERDGRGAVVSTVEHVRIPFWEHGARVRDGHPYTFTVIALDRDGKTMAAEEVKGDEAVDPITPWQR